MTHFCINFIF